MLVDLVSTTGSKLYRWPPEQSLSLFHYKCTKRKNYKYLYLGSEFGWILKSRLSLPPIFASVHDF